MQPSGSILLLSQLASPINSHCNTSRLPKPSQKQSRVLNQILPTHTVFWFLWFYTQIHLPEKVFSPNTAPKPWRQRREFLTCKSPAGKQKWSVLLLEKQETCNNHMPLLMSNSVVKISSKRKKKVTFDSNEILFKKQNNNKTRQTASSSAGCVLCSREQTALPSRAPLPLGAHTPQVRE